MCESVLIICTLCKVDPSLSALAQRPTCQKFKEEFWSKPFNQSVEEVNFFWRNMYVAQSVCTRLIFSAYRENKMFKNLYKWTWLSDLSLDLYELINSQLLGSFYIDERERFRDTLFHIVLYGHSNVYTLCVCAPADTFTRCFFIIICADFDISLIVLGSLFWRFVTQYTCLFVLLLYFRILK